jgi:hypothetical protein
MASLCYCVLLHPYLSAAVEAKKAMYNHLVIQCNGQINRPFPVMSKDQSVEEYEPKLKAWLHEKAR